METENFLCQSDDVAHLRKVSLKPDCKTAHKTAQINSDGRASRMTARPHTMSSADETEAFISDRRLGVCLLSNYLLITYCVGHLW